MKRFPTAILVGCIAVALPQCGPRETSPAGDVPTPDRAGDPSTGPKPAQPDAAAPPAAAIEALEWNTYHGNAALTGAAAVQLPEKLVLRWRFTTDAPVRNTPVAGGGRLHFSDLKGRLYCIDLEGRPVWSKQLVRDGAPDTAPIEEVFDAPLAWFEDTLVAGSIDGVVYALDPATGDERWTAELDGLILGTPNFLPGKAAPDTRQARLFVIEQGNGALHCLDFATGNRIWTTEGVNRCDGSPSVGENEVIFGSCAAALHIFSAGNGALLREIEIDEDSQVAGGVAIVGDSVFSGSRSGKVLHANLRTGAVVWINEDSEDEVFTTPAVNDAWVVFGSSDGNIYGLDRATGRRKWTCVTDGQPSSPVIAGDTVVAASDGTLFLLRLTDGAKLWSYEISDTITSPAIVGGLVVVGSDDSTVAAFGAPQP